MRACIEWSVLVIALLAAFLFVGVFTLIAFLYLRHEYNNLTEQERKQVDDFWNDSRNRRFME